MPPGLNCVIDLSHHNNSVDFGKLAAAGVVGVIHKATQGADGVDPTYVFSPGICWSGLRVNRSGSEVQRLQINS